MKIGAQSLVAVLFLFLAPLIYDLFLDSSLSIDIQMLPLRTDLATSMVRVLGGIIVFVLAGIAGSLTVASACLAARLPAFLAALLLGMSVLLISENYSFSQVIFGKATPRDVASVGLVAMYVSCGWAAGALALRWVRSRAHAKAKN